MREGLLPGAREAISYIVRSNIYMSLGAFFVAYMSSVVLSFPLRPVALFVPFSAAMFIYTLNRHTDKREDSVNLPGRVEFFERHGNYLLILGSILYIAGIVLSLLRGITLLLLALFPGIVSVLYSIGRFKRPIYGNLFVAFAWGITPLYISAYFGSFSMQSLMLYLFFSLEFFINTTVFDIKDVKGDLTENIRTLPNRFGLEKTKKWLQIINLLTGFLLIIGFFAGLIPDIGLILIALILYSGIYIHLADQKKGEIFYGLIVDGEFIFTAAIFFIIGAL